MTVGCIFQPSLKTVQHNFARVTMMMTHLEVDDDLNVEVAAVEALVDSNKPVSKKPEVSPELEPEQTPNVALQPEPEPETEQALLTVKRSLHSR